MIMNKKGFGGAGIGMFVAIIIGGLLLLNVIGIGVFVSKLSNTPILYILLFIGLLILIFKMKK